MQDYNPLLPSGLISDDRQTINDNMESIITDFSGTAFPTNNLYAGMKCNRTDQSKVYQLQADLATWKQIYDYSGAEITVPKANKAVLDVDGNPIKTTYLKSVPVYVGATTNTAGVVGLVPSAQIYQKDYFLKGNGEWAAIAVMQGATTSAAGIAGLVPAPVAGDNVKFFTGAGNYQAVATQAQAEAGTDNSAPMTALRVKQAIEAFVGNYIPTGTILPFAGGTIPSGFLACNGAAVSRTTYASLYSAIGTTFGAGDGSTTFNLPNAESDKFLQGNSTPGTVKAPGLPNITGNGPRVDQYYLSTPLTGPFGKTNTSGPRRSTDIGSDNSPIITFDASKANSIYGAANTVQPPSLTVRFIIKY